MNPRAAELQRQISVLSAALMAELAAAPDMLGAEPAPAWLSVEGFAARLGVSRRTVYRMIEEGLPYKRVRRRTRRIPVADADAWIATRRDAERAASLDGPRECVR